MPDADFSSGSGAGVGMVPGAGLPPKSLGTCRNPKCAGSRQQSEPAHDGKCPHCGAPMNIDNQTKDPRSENQTMPSQSPDASMTQAGMITSSNEDATEDEDEHDNTTVESECSFCGLAPVVESACPRCGTMQEDAEQAKAVQDSAPKSYQPGGPLPQEDHPMNCAACGYSMGESVACDNCGYRLSEEEEIEWSSTVTPSDFQEARFSVSLAMMCNEQQLKALANSIVWGENPKKEYETETLAETPPRWLPENHHELWNVIISENNFTTYSQGVNSLKRYLL